ncbi:MAG TPA: delta-60 repeat domain-containing protein, partial [Bacteroidia bacterium]|nr:delta-60 repeat domain-containing protein [Bacteroidia bacterium]
MFRDHIACNYISRLLPDGSIDSTFLQVNKTTQRINGTCTSAIQPDGKIVFGGYFKEVNTCTANNLVRLNADGTLDHTFNKTTGANGTIRASAIQKNGKIIIGGNFYAYQYKSRNHIARLTKNGTIDNSFDP